MTQSAESSGPLVGENPTSQAVRDGVSWLESTVADWGLNDLWSEVVSAAIGVIIVLAACFAANLLAKLLIDAVVNRWLHRRKSPWAQALAEHKVFRRLSQLLPVGLLALALPAFAHYGVDTWLRPLLEIYVIFVILIMLFGLLEVGEVVVNTRGMSDKIPVTGISQAAKVVLAFFAVILSMSVLVAQSPLLLLSGLGAVAAVLMLIFKDPILGLVAGIQITANKMVRVGDWIQIDSLGVDGTVEEITMTTIRVVGFDRTLSLVPAYDLISKPFINWQAMTDSGGRRIKRSINIDIETVRFVTAADLEQFRRFSVLAEYLDARTKEIDDWAWSFVRNQRTMNNTILL